MSITHMTWLPSPGSPQPQTRTNCWSWEASQTWSSPLKFPELRKLKQRVVNLRIPLATCKTPCLTKQNKTQTEKGRGWRDELVGKVLAALCWVSRDVKWITRARSPAHLVNLSGGGSMRNSPSKNKVESDLERHLMSTFGLRGHSHGCARPRTYHTPTQTLTMKTS